MSEKDKFIHILEDEILKLRIEQEQDEKFYSSLSEIIPFITDNGIFDLTLENIKFIKEEVTKKVNLSKSEIEFIDAINELDRNTRYTILKIGLSDIQKATILNLKRNLEMAKATENKKLMEENLSKANFYEHVLSIITKDDFIVDFDSIKVALDQLNIKVEDQIKLFAELNAFNLSIYKNKFSKNSYDEEEVIKEEDLMVTNIASKNLEVLFSKFSLDFDKIYLNNDENKNRLLKYGNIIKIEENLDFLQSTPYLKFIYTKPEILTNILLFSSREDMEEVLRIAKEGNIINIIKKFPTILYPAIERRTNNDSKVRTNSKKVYQTGCIKRFLENVKILKDLDIDIKDAYDKCVTFFTQTPTIIRKIIDALNLYGIRKEHIRRNLTLSVFRTFESIQKNLDIAIEVGSNCIGYCRENLSRLSSSSTVNFYRIKYARKLAVLENRGELFSPYNASYSSLRLKGIFVEPKSIIYGSKPEDTFMLYGASKPQIEQEGIYDEIIKNNDNSSISSQIYNNDVIKQLDQNYMSPQDPLVYRFYGVAISRLKVLRYLNTLIKNGIEISKDSLMYAICINSMLDDIELEKINECINKIDILGRSHYDR